MSAPNPCPCVSQTRPARPITWQGWAIYFGFVFTLVILAQFIGRWVFAGFAPIAIGIWLIAGVLFLTGAYMAAIRRFSRPQSSQYGEPPHE
jgi:lipopolysaccharide export LptBFGC system permease protein LptF